MMHEPLVMRFQRPETTLLRVDDQYKFNPKKHWSWLQKLAWKFLLKTDALNHGVDYKTTYREVVIDRRKVSETILEAMHEMQIAHIKPKIVYMGPEKMDELLNECRDASFSFEVTMGFNRTIYGLPVTVIPWMRGVLVVPEQ